jgi:hypothetical protein
MQNSGELRRGNAAVRLADSKLPIVIAREVFSPGR